MLFLLNFILISNQKFKAWKICLQILSVIDRRSFDYCFLLLKRALATAQRFLRWASQSPIYCLILVISNGRKGILLEGRIIMP